MPLFVFLIVGNIWSIFKMASSSQELNQITQQLSTSSVKDFASPVRVIEVEEDEIQAGFNQWTNRVIIKVFHEKPIRLGDAKRFATRYWKGYGEFEFSFEAVNIFVITFENLRDKKDLLSKDYTSLDGHLTLVREWNPGLTLEDVDFSTVKVTYEIQNMPREYQTPKLNEGLQS